jgi:SnoaL-like domain
MAGAETTATVEQRLQRLEDLEAIRKLFLEYGRYLDEKDFEPCSRLFATDGEFVLPFDTVKGPDGVLAVMNDMLGRDLAQDPGKDIHVFANPTIELDGDRATARSFWIYVTPNDTGYPQIAQFGHYEDILAREEGVWKFARRDAQRDIGIPGGGVPGVAQ